MFINDKNMSSIFKLFFYISLSFIVVLGIYLRIVSMISGFDIFYDEAALIYNIENKKIFELFGKLEFSQCCPPLFLIISKFVYLKYGASEIALRFFPCLFSILAQILFLFITLKIFKNKISILASNLIFALSEKIILYGMFFKHYLVDVFFSTLILFILFFIKDFSFSRKNLFFLSITALIVSVFSYTSIFLIVCFVILLILKNLNKLSFYKIKKSMYFIIPYTIGMSIFAYVNFVKTIKDDLIQSYWSDCFTMIPKNYDGIQQLVSFLGGEIVNQNIAIILLILSFLFFIFKKDYSFKFIWLVFFFAILLGILNLYPLSCERVSLYLIPFFIISIIKPIDSINLKNKFINNLLIILCLIPIFNYSKVSDYYEKNKNKPIKEMVQFLWIKEYKKEKSVCAKQFVKLLYEFNCSKKDYIYCKCSNNLVLPLYDIEKRIEEYNICYDYNYKEFLKNIPLGSIVYFAISCEYDENYDEVKDWIDENLEILLIKEIGNYEYIKAIKK